MLITYFKSLNFPLSEATRIQFFNIQGHHQKIVFTKTLLPCQSFNKITILSVYLLPIYLPYLVIKSLFHDVRVFGPLDSLLLKILQKFVRGSRIYTDAGDYSHSDLKYPFNPVMDLSLKDDLVKKTIDDGSIRILYMSHASEFKGFNDIVRLCSILKDQRIHLRVCFSKPVTNYTIDFLERELGSDIDLEILGVVDYREQLKWADIYYYVYWTERWTYIVPLSLLEAIMVGCVPIGPRHPSVKKWINDDFLVDPKQLDQSLHFLKKYSNQKQIYHEKIKINRSFLVANCEWIETKRNLND